MNQLSLHRQVSLLGAQGQQLLVSSMLFCCSLHLLLACKGRSKPAAGASCSKKAGMETHPAILAHAVSFSTSGQRSARL